jgi:hypothetical protein
MSTAFKELLKVSATLRPSSHCGKTFPLASVMRSTPFSIKKFCIDIRKLASAKRKKIAVSPYFVVKSPIFSCQCVNFAFA